MQQSCTCGSVRGASGNWRPYRDRGGDTNSVGTASKLPSNLTYQGLTAFCIRCQPLKRQIIMAKYPNGDHRACVGTPRN
jgi:hypothetical protein